jgi:hypothetical protein
MNGQDVIVAIKLASPALSKWTFAKLASATGLSASEAHASVGRLRLSGLVSEKSWRVAAAQLAEFLVHGLPYVFPERPGGETIGIPTGSFLESIRAELGLASGQPLVWPYPGGSVRGGAVEPLHRSVPRIAIIDPQLHELLALVDCVRLGRPRERSLAAGALRRRLTE